MKDSSGRSQNNQKKTSKPLQPLLASVKVRVPGSTGRKRERIKRYLWASSDTKTNAYPKEQNQISDFLHNILMIPKLKKKCRLLRHSGICS